MLNFFLRLIVYILAGLAALIFALDISGANSASEFLLPLAGFVVASLVITLTWKRRKSSLLASGLLTCVLGIPTAILLIDTTFNPPIPAFGFADEKKPEGLIAESILKDPITRSLLQPTREEHARSLEKAKKFYWAILVLLVFQTISVYFLSRRQHSNLAPR